MYRLVQITLLTHPTMSVIQSPVSDGLRRFDSDGSLVDSGIEDAELMPGYPDLRFGFPWGDGQMLELLSSQPCLGWLE